jgi:hypothetical protein
MTLHGIGLANIQAFEFKSFSFNPTHVVYLSKVTVAIASIFSYFLARSSCSASFLVDQTYKRVEGADLHSVVLVHTISRF